MHFRLQRPVYRPRPRGPRLCLSEAGCAGRVPACCKRGVRVEEDGNVTFSSRGFCTPVEKVRDDTKFTLTLLDLGSAEDPAETLESAAAAVQPDGADHLFICPPGSLRESRRRRGIRFRAVEPEDILPHVLAPDVALGEVVVAVATEPTGAPVTDPNDDIVVPDGLGG